MDVSKAEKAIPPYIAADRFWLENQASLSGVRPVLEHQCQKCRKILSTDKFKAVRGKGDDFSLRGWCIDCQRIEDKRNAMSHRSGYVYLLQTKRACKIGYSAKPYQRVRSMTKTSDASKLIVTIQSDDARQLEQRLHMYFRANGKHLNGEWFKLNKRDIAYIKSLASGGNDPNVYQRPLF